jgi:hypothetical protein
MKGKKLSEQHKLKISKSLTSKKLSNETKLKISSSLKNNPSFWRPWRRPTAQNQIKNINP